LLECLLLLHGRALLQTASQRAIQVSLRSIWLLSIEEFILILRRLLINLRISIYTGQHSVLLTLNANLVYSLFAVGTHMYIGQHQLMIWNELLPLLIGFQRW
jgi:hypothetical protein